MRRLLTCSKCKKTMCHSCLSIKNNEYRCKCLKCEKSKLANLDFKIVKKKENNC